ncbi:MAG: efflux RND transporter periplasmic adaptor subunit [Burkholderiales bacterium]|nr:efflux RND transporter periplasmic adaptor subunit [Burkholderiales bacterium]
MIVQRRYALVIFALCLTGALIYGFMPKPVLVETAAVKRGLFQVTIEEEGKTRVKDRFKISAPVAGVMHRLHWEVGDSVAAGEMLCEITPLKSVLLDPRSKAEAEDRVAAAEAALRTAQARVTADKASAEFAHAEYLRIRKIYDKKLIALSALERAESEKRRTAANLESAGFAVETARYTLQEARNALSHFASEGREELGEHVVVHAPVDGQILVIYRESEGTVAAGQVLMEIGDAHALEVVVEVLSSDAVRIKSGLPVEFSRWGGEQPLEGRVQIIEPAGFTKISALGVEEQRVRVIVEFTSPPQHWVRLGDGYRVDTRFILWQGENVLQIPQNALFRHEAGWAVFVAGKSNKAELRTVEPGKRSGLRAQILDGLREGEEIITHPDEQLAHGMRIRRE